MNVYACTSFVGFYPVPTAAVVVAETPADAAQQLEATLIEMGLFQHIKPEVMELVDPSARRVVMLSDGEY